MPITTIINTSNVTLISPEVNYCAFLQFQSHHISVPSQGYLTLAF